MLPRILHRPASESISLWYDRGMGLFDIFLGGNEAKKRVEDLQRRLKANPTNVTCALELADAYAKTGAQKQAVQLLNRLGPALQKSGQYMGAIAVYKRISELDPKGTDPATAGALKELEKLQLQASAKTLPTSTIKISSAETAAESAAAQAKREELAPLFQKIPIFKDVPPHLLAQLVQKIHLRTLDAGVVLFEEGAPGSSLFFVVSGELQVTGKGEGGRDVVLRTMGEGEVIGEISFLSQLPRSATLKTKAPSVLIELERRAVDDVIRKSPKLREALQVMYKDRVLNDVLVRSKVFGPLPESVRKEIAQMLVPLTVEGGDPIPPAGMSGEAVYLIAQGVVRITAKDQYGHEVERAMLSPPSFFGDLGRERAEALASASALVDVELYRLGQAELMPLLSAHPELWSALDEINLAKLGNASGTGTHSKAT